MIRLIKVSKIMFDKVGVHPPGGMYSFGHLALLLFFGIAAYLFVRFTKKWSQAQMMIFFKVSSIFLALLEIFKIAWNIAMYGFSIEMLNRFMPLYYCSIYIYAFLLLSWTKGYVAEASKSWIVYGGTIAGLAFLIYPSSSLLEYPAFHFLSIHSIFFHTALVLTGYLLLKFSFYRPQRRDLVKFTYFSLVFMVAAFIMNKTLGTNLMFLEKPLAMPVFTALNNISPLLFQILMFLGQLFLPFVFTHFLFLLIKQSRRIKIYENEEKSEEISTTET